MDASKKSVRAKCRAKVRAAVEAATILAIGIVIAFGVNPASARFMDGNKLYEICVTNPIVTGCIGYITGVADLMESPACPPAETTIEQITDVAIIYLKDHPAERSMPAALLVRTAIIAAWHCKAP